MLYEITHITEYTYSDSVALSHHILRLRPRNIPHQTCVEHQITVRPSPSTVSEYQDYFGNDTVYVAMEGPHEKLTLTARSKIAIDPAALPSFHLDASWETVRDICETSETEHIIKASEFTFDSPLVQCRPEYQEYASASFAPSRPLNEAVQDLTRRIYEDFKFDPEATSVATPIEEVFRTRRGVCQDFAHFQIACLRSFGLPARYVSGYIETDPPPGQPRLQGADASHAWVEYYSLESGWLAVDPTNNCTSSGRHITTAWGRDYNDICPIKGVILGGGTHSLAVGVDVVRLE